MRQLAYFFSAFILFMLLYSILTSDFYGWDMDMSI